ncbi:Diphthine synthase [uncultured archaeon]|nr:Diphthine synthase [uncultured archaeon]
MLYLIGLGLDESGISKSGLEAVKKCRKVYLENYTVNFPYPEKKIEKTIGKKIISVGREIVEGNELIKEAKKGNICLLVYGSPLTATTHISLIQEAKKNKVKCKIICNASIFDAIAETGLQIYKFGKIASMPKWSKSYKPTSFMEIVKQNKEIDAHSLILIDIGLDLKDALEELEKSAEEYGIKPEKILVCSRLGAKDSRIIYKEISQLKNAEIKKPYCIIIPSRLHFMESEVLEKF